VGRAAIDSILAAKLDAPFTSLFEFCERVDLRLCNRRVFEALIQSGALDALGGHRAQLIAALDAAISEAGLKQEEASIGQGSLFGDLGPASDPVDGQAKHGPTLPNTPIWSDSERLSQEKAILGFYISGHPLEPFRTECELFASHTVAQLQGWTAEKMALGVVITAVKRQVSKNSQKEFARLTVEDFSGSAEVLVFPEAWSVLADRIRTDVPVLIKGGYGRRDQDNEKPTYIVDEVIPLAERRTNGAVIVSLQLRASAGLSPAVMEDIRAVAESHPGSAPLEVSWIDGRGSSSRFRSRTLTMAADGAALTELRALLGHERVRLVRGN